jgi:hypothetical protein
MYEIKGRAFKKETEKEDKAIEKLQIRPSPQQEGPCSSVPFPSHHESPPPRAALLHHHHPTAPPRIDLLGYLPSPRSSSCACSPRSCAAAASATAIGLPRRRRPPAGLRSRGKHLCSFHSSNAARSCLGSAAPCPSWFLWAVCLRLLGRSVLDSVETRREGMDYAGHFVPTIVRLFPLRRSQQVDTGVTVVSFGRSVQFACPRRCFRSSSPPRFFVCTKTVVEVWVM